MAQIVTITNPLTGQPAQVDQLDHTAQEIDDAIARALPGGAIDTALQNKLGGVESADHPGCYYRMVGSVVEWFNPPMQLGVEYRTTERYQGKPVYVKTIDCGAMPSSERKAVDHSISDIENVIRCVGQRSNGDSIPSRYSESDYASIFAGNARIYIYVGIDMSATTATAQLWYTKTTD